MIWNPVNKCHIVNEKPTQRRIPIYEIPDTRSPGKEHMTYPCPLWRDEGAAA